MFQSLKHRNFRIYYAGQLISLNGTWMQSVAQSWLVYRLTGSGLMLGLAGMLTLMPNLFLGLVGGWLADHFDKRRLLVIFQLLAMLQALMLAVLTLLEIVQPWHILLLALLLGLIQALETPVRQSFISQLVPRQNLANAIAMSSSMFHLARFTGPALAGVLVAMLGEGTVFLINALTFVAIVLSLRMLVLEHRIIPAETSRGLRSLLEGFHYAWQHQLTRTLLATVALVSLTGSSMTVLLPIFVAEVFMHGAESLGVFMGMLGAGSLTAALTLARRKELRLLERRVAMAAIVIALGLLGFSFNTKYYLALLILFLIGMASTTVFASSNALIQLAVPDGLRGRTMALFTLCLHGVGSIGYIIMGSGADLISVSDMMMLAGLVLLFSAVFLGKQLYAIRHL